jgi:hypothetical protein
MSNDFSIEIALVMLSVLVGSIFYGPTGSAMYFMVTCGLVFIGVLGYLVISMIKNPPSTGGNGGEFATYVASGLAQMAMVPSMIVIVLCLLLGINMAKKS